MQFFRTFFLVATFTSSLFALEWERSGSFKSIGAVEQLRQSGLFTKDENFFLEERLRLGTVLSIEKFRFEYAGDTSLFWQRPNPSAFALPDLTPQSAWNARWSLLSGNEAYAFHKIDRLSLKYSFGTVEIYAGKQVVPTGVGQFFAAVSQVQRYPYIFIDPEYQKTEDVVGVTWSGPLQIEGRFLPKVASQKEHNFHFRVKGNRGGYDIALTSGRSDDKPYVGLETAGNISDALLRAELVGYFLKDETLLQSLIGMDYVFSSRFSGKVEGFYNGLGREKPYRFRGYRHRSAPYRGRWYGAMELVWEAHPLLRVTSHLVSNLEDPSFLVHLFLNYSISQDLDVLVGHYQCLGGQDAEFGGVFTTLVPGVQFGYSDLSYFAVRFYF